MRVGDSEGSVRWWPVHLIRMNSVHECQNGSVAVTIFDLFVTYQTRVACGHAGALLDDKGYTVDGCGVA